MIEELLTDAVFAEEIVGDDPDTSLLPSEQDMVANAVEKRRREVTYARTCARRALRRLGVPEVPILRGTRGEPLWPSGVVGAITHTTGYYAATVADAAKVRALGIDAEVHDRLPDGVLDHIAFDEELAWIRTASRDVWWDRLLFSAKESVYKVWYPLAKRWLGFEDARITLHPETGTFDARILVDGSTLDGGPPLTNLSGRFLVSDGFVLTAIVLPSKG